MIARTPLTIALRAAVSILEPAPGVLVGTGVADESLTGRRFAGDGGVLRSVGQPTIIEGSCFGRVLRTNHVTG